MSAAWHLLTGEYPPRFGGVADYTRLVAGALAATGVEVHVWAPRVDGDPPTLPGVTVHRVANGWSKHDRAAVDTALNLCPTPRRLVVQYTPNAWGQRGMNLGFGRWLNARRQKGDDVWAMVHEGFYIVHRGDPLKYWALAAAHRVMIRDLIRASSRVYYSMPYWDDKLRSRESEPRGRPMTWLPVPSNIPRVDDPDGVAAVKRRLAPDGQAIIGNFGTYGADLRALLGRVLPPLLEGRDDCVGVLLGRHGDVFLPELIAEHPGLGGRITATGGIPAEDASRHLQACDVMVQPYEFGVSTRRGTVMAALEHGRPIATTFGNVTEPIWSESHCVAAVDVADLDMLPTMVQQLLADAPARRELGGSGLELYERRFAVARTAETMIRDAHCEL